MKVCWARSEQRCRPTASEGSFPLFYRSVNPIYSVLPKLEILRSVQVITYMHLNHWMAARRFVEMIQAISMVPQY